MVTTQNSHRYEVVLDDGRWLRPLLASASKRTQAQPDQQTVERIRNQVFYQIERESALVA